MELIQPLAKSTYRPGCLGGIGGFGGLFEIPVERYQQPVLVSGTDGVGTKLKFAFEIDRHDSIGIDLVAMCVNDVVTCGAEPLFFLDYFATSSLQLPQAESVISGIARGCIQAGVALVGGETAEMPGLYTPGEYDLAGFCVGVVEKDHIIDGKAIRTGDRILGLASSGPHANGYSLIRAIRNRCDTSLDTLLSDNSLGDALMAPTLIYVRSTLALLEQISVCGIAHITGGGLPENVRRIIPEGLEARINSSNWERPTVFDWLQEEGGIANAEMLRTFNCGIGLVLVVRPDDEPPALKLLEQHGERVFSLGKITTGDRGVVID